jgi:DNA repair ATPase RecN
MATLKKLEMVDKMDISKEELQELKDYEKEEEQINAQKQLIEDYEKLVDLIDFPPLNLLINSKSFNDEINKAFDEISKKKEYDKELFGKIEKKFKFEIDSARAAMKQHKTPQKAAREYMKKNPKIDIEDFSNVYLIRFKP